jgi:hypothetical protein
MKDIIIDPSTVTVQNDVVNTLYRFGMPIDRRIILSYRPLARYYISALSGERNQNNPSGQEIMSSKNSNDPNDPSSASTTAPPQRHFRPPIDEESIPWAEIILEEEPSSAQMSPGTGFSSQLLSTHAENPLDYQVVGPPLAVLAVVLLAFLLLAAR